MKKMAFESIKWREDILLYAFRYCLGRNTYAVGTIINSLEELWPSLSSFFKLQVKKEIEVAKDRCELGDETSRIQWGNFLYFITENDKA